MSVGSVSSSNASYWDEFFGNSASKKSQKGGDLASMLFQDMDADKSGGLSLDESGLDQKQYNALDTDQDGKVTQEELRAELELQRQAMHTRIQLGGGDEASDSDDAQSDSGKTRVQKLLSEIVNGEKLDGPPPGSIEKPHKDGDFASKVFNDLDSDQNGGIDLKESGLSKAMFDSMDLNQDGTVSADELSEAFEKQRTMFAAKTQNNSATPQGIDSASAQENGGAADLFGENKGSRAQRFLANLASNAYSAGMSLGGGDDGQALSVTA